MTILKFLKAPVDYEINPSPYLMFNLGHNSMNSVTVTDGY
jgi:hypothetical protein